MGAEVKHFFLTMGRYDAVAIVEAPNDETVAKVELLRAATGAVRTKTMRAFTEEAVRKTIASLP
jgi:uncharacterized protein with GYD domain